MTKIFDLYKDILSTGSLTVGEDAMVSATMGKTSNPFMVDGKRLVLPTREHLSNMGKDKVAFHPLSENFLRGESKVMERFRSAINTKLNFTLGSLMEELLTLVISVAEHQHMSPEQSKLLIQVKDADEKTLAALRSLLKTMGIGDKEKCIVHVFLKRGGTVNGKGYSRAAIIGFPLYKELQKKEKTVFGVTMRARDRDAIASLLEYIIPGIENVGAFDRGSESDISPFLDALMRGLMGIAGRINAVVEDFRKFLDNPDTYLYSDSWVEVFDNLAQMLPEIRAIPMQTGNEGDTTGKAKVMATNTAGTFGLAVAPYSPVAPVAQFTQPQYTQFGQQTQQPMPMPVTPPITSNGGLDFSSALRNNPALAGMFPNQGYGQPMPVGPAALRNTTPVWAQPQYQQPQPMYNNQGGFGSV